MPASEYATNLLSVAGGGTRYKHALAGLAQTRGLAKRLMSILRPGRNTNPLSPGSLATVLVFAILLLFPIVTLDFIAKERLGPAVKQQSTAEQRTDIDRSGTRESSNRGIEGDRLRIIKRTEDSIYFTYTIGN